MSNYTVINKWQEKEKSKQKILHTWATNRKQHHSPQTPESQPTKSDQDDEVLLVDEIRDEDMISVSVRVA